MAKEIIEAFCPVCGHGLGEIRTDHMLDLRNNEKHFGVSRPTGYKGFGNSKYIEEDYNQGFFVKVKDLFLAAIKVWLEKGWLKKKDLQDLMKQ